jgi:hypothetical protein
MGEYTAEKPIIGVQVFATLDFHIWDEKIGEVFVELGDYSLFWILVTGKYPWTITRCGYRLPLCTSSQRFRSLDFGFQFNTQTVP